MSNDFKDLKFSTVELLEYIEAYENKPTKATSKRIRLSLTAFKKKVAKFRQAMLELDKAK